MQPLGTVILPDNGFLDHIRMALNMHISESIGFETLARECLSFSWHRESGIVYNHGPDRFPAIDYYYFNQVMSRYSEILSSPDLNAMYIELRFNISLENGLEFMVIEYLPFNHRQGRFM